MNQLTTLRNQLHHAMVERDTAQSALDTIQSEYDAAFKQWQQENATLVERHEQAEKEARAKTATFQRIRTEASDLLKEAFYDDDELPEGFTQQRNRTVIYDEQGFLKVARDNFPFLLAVDKKATKDFFFKMAVEVDGKLILPEHIRRWASVEIAYQPGARISNSTIAKLDISEPETPVLQSNDKQDEDESELDFALEPEEELVLAGILVPPATDKIHF